MKESKYMLVFNVAILRTILIACILMGSKSCINNKKVEGNLNIVEKKQDNTSEIVDVDQNAQFLITAAEIDLEEIRLGQLAQHNSTMTNVKELGKMMKEVHRKSLYDVTALARKKTIHIPASPNNHAKDLYKKLSIISGIDFDKTYCDIMVNENKDAIISFEKAFTESSDEDIRKYAAATLPSLRTHLDYAIMCQKTCKRL